MSSLKKNAKMLNTLLDQGRTFLLQQSEYKRLVEPNLKLIEQTSGPKLGSLVETLVNPPTDESNTKTYDKSKKKTTKETIDLSGLVVKFNTLLREYNEATDAQLTRAQSNKNIIKQTRKVEEINIKLIDILKKMDGIVAKSGMGDSRNITNKLNEQRKVVYERSLSLNKVKDNTQGKLTNISSLKGENQDSKLKVKSAYYDYLVWTVVAITLGAFTIKYTIHR